MRWRRRKNTLPGVGAGAQLSSCSTEAPNSPLFTVRQGRARQGSGRVDIVTETMFLNSYPIRGILEELKRESGLHLATQLRVLNPGSFWILSALLGDAII